MEQELDFDYLCKLNKSNPEKFEALRKQLIEEAIQKARASSQRRLRGLQFQVDATREIHKNAPFVACIEVSKIMHQSFGELRCRLNEALDMETFPSLNAKANEPTTSQTCTKINQAEGVVLSFNRRP